MSAEVDILLDSFSKDPKISTEKIINLLSSDDYLQMRDKTLNDDTHNEQIKIQSKILNFMVSNGIIRNFSSNYYSSLLKLCNLFHPQLLFTVLSQYIHPELSEAIQKRVIKLIYICLIINNGLVNILKSVYSNYNLLDLSTFNYSSSKLLHFLITVQSMATQCKVRDCAIFTDTIKFCQYLLDQLLRLYADFEEDDKQYLSCFMEIFSKLVNHTDGNVWKIILRNKDFNSFFIEKNCLSFSRNLHLEKHITSILIHSDNFDTIKRYFRQCSQNDTDFQKLFGILKRIVFVRQLRHLHVLPSIFKVFYLLSVDHNSSIDSKYTDLIDEKLGIDSLKIWKNPVSIEKNSLRQRMYNSIAVSSWITEFRIPLKRPFLDICEFVLAGISNHLAAPRNEIRYIGMCLGEFLMNKCQLQEHVDQTEHLLKFEYPETEHVNELRKFLKSEDLMHNDHLQKSATEENEDEKDTPESELDSDDDSDSDTSLNLPSNPLEPFTKFDKTEEIDGWPPSDYRPRYVRECLDGLQMTQPEDKSVFLGCVYAAEKLFFSHPSAVRDFSLDIVKSLLYMNPSANPYEACVAKCRQKSLVAVTVLHPEKVANYLGNEFAQPNMSIALRGDILRTLTHSACVLSESKPSSKAKNSEMILKGQGVNIFSKFASDFFFPLSKSVPQLLNSTGTYKHQDHVILAQLVATLSSIYACARYAPQREEMKSELIDLSIEVLRRESESYVRRAAITALGTVLNLPCLRCESTLHDEEKILEILNEVIKHDLDEETKMLAQLAFTSSVPMNLD